MGFEHNLQFFVHHAESIIQWTVFLLVLLGLTLAARSIFSRVGPTDEQTGEIDAKVRKILASSPQILNNQANVASGSPAAAHTGGAAAAASAASNGAEAAALKAEIEKRDKEISEWKAKAEAATDSNEVAGYLKKIKELEGKLAEYEILEDDIADLSLYKEENARLKAELGKNQGAGGAGEPEPAAQGVTAPKEDFVAEFKAAVETQKPSAPATKPIEPPKVKAEPKDASTGEEDDLLTEFAASLEEKSGPSTSDDPEPLDTEKMLAEMAEMENVGSAESSLDSDADMEKMAAEASKLLDESKT